MKANDAPRRRTSYCAVNVHLRTLVFDKQRALIHGIVGSKLDDEYVSYLDGLLYPSGFDLDCRTFNADYQWLRDDFLLFMHVCSQFVNAFRSECNVLYRCKVPGVGSSMSLEEYLPVS